MEGMESDGECFFQVWFRTWHGFKSRAGLLILDVEIQSFAVAVHDIAESRVTSTIGRQFGPGIGT